MTPIHVVTGRRNRSRAGPPHIPVAHGVRSTGAPECRLFSRPTTPRPRDCGRIRSPPRWRGMLAAQDTYALPELKWVSLAWRAGGVPPYVSFAFWEWVTCAV